MLLAMWRVSSSVLTEPFARRRGLERQVDLLPRPHSVYLTCDVEAPASPNPGASSWELRVSYDDPAAPKSAADCVGKYKYMPEEGQRNLHLHL